MRIDFDTFGCSAKRLATDTLNESLPFALYLGAFAFNCPLTELRNATLAGLALGTACNAYSMTDARIDDYKGRLRNTSSDTDYQLHLLGSVATYLFLRFCLPDLEALTELKTTMACGIATALAIPLTNPLILAWRGRREIT